MTRRKASSWKAYLERETKILNRQRRGGGGNWIVAQFKFPGVRSIRGRAQDSMRAEDGGRLVRRISQAVCWR